MTSDIKWLSGFGRRASVEVLLDEITARIYFKKNKKNA
jgi:hypothetical protein